MGAETHHGCEAVRPDDGHANHGNPPQPLSDPVGTADLIGNPPPGPLGKQIANGLMGDGAQTHVGVPERRCLVHKGTRIDAEIDLGVGSNAAWR